MSPARHAGLARAVRPPQARKPHLQADSPVTSAGIRLPADGECLVSNYRDWTNIDDALRARFRWPVVPLDRLQNSVENLDRLATEPDES